MNLFLHHIALHAEQGLMPFGAYREPWLNKDFERALRVLANLDASQGLPNDARRHVAQLVAPLLENLEQLERGETIERSEKFKLRLMALWMAKDYSKMALLLFAGQSPQQSLQILAELPVSRSLHKILAATPPAMLALFFSGIFQRHGTLALALKHARHDLGQSFRVMADDENIGMQQARELLTAVCLQLARSNHGHATLNHLLFNGLDQADGETQPYYGALETLHLMQPQVYLHPEKLHANSKTVFQKNALSLKSASNTARASRLSWGTSATVQQLLAHPRILGALSASTQATLIQQSQRSQAKREDLEVFLRELWAATDAPLEQDDFVSDPMELHFRSLRHLLQGGEYELATHLALGTLSAKQSWTRLIRRLRCAEAAGLFAHMRPAELEQYMAELVRVFGETDFELGSRLSRIFSYFALDDEAALPGGQSITLLSFLDSLLSDPGPRRALGKLLLYNGLLTANAEVSCFWTAVLERLHQNHKQEWYKPETIVRTGFLHTNDKQMVYLKPLFGLTMFLTPLERARQGLAELESASASTRAQGVARIRACVRYLDVEDRLFFIEQVLRFADSQIDRSVLDAVALCLNDWFTRSFSVYFHDNKSVCMTHFYIRSNMGIELSAEKRQLFNDLGNRFHHDRGIVNAFQATLVKTVRRWSPPYTLRPSDLTALQATGIYSPARFLTCIKQLVHAMGFMNLDTASWDKLLDMLRQRLSDPAIKGETAYPIAKTLVEGCGWPAREFPGTDKAALPRLIPRLVERIEDQNQILDIVAAYQDQVSFYIDRPMCIFISFTAPVYIGLLNRVSEENLNRLVDRVMADKDKRDVYGMERHRQWCILRGLLWRSNDSALQVKVLKYLAQFSVENKIHPRFLELLNALKETGKLSDDAHKEFVKNHLAALLHDKLLDLPALARVYVDGVLSVPSQPFRWKCLKQLVAEYRGPDSQSNASLLEAEIERLSLATEKPFLPQWTRGELTGKNGVVHYQEYEFWKALEIMTQGMSVAQRRVLFQMAIEHVHTSVALTCMVSGEGIETSLSYEEMNHNYFFDFLNAQLKFAKFAGNPELAQFTKIMVEKTYPNMSLDSAFWMRWRSVLARWMPVTRP